MLLYHGSDHIIKEPSYGYGSTDNDYGCGFYLTEDIEMARLWAVANGSPEKAVVNKYEIFVGSFKEYNLDTFGLLAWVSEIIYNRGLSNEALKEFGNKLASKYKVNMENADIISGYRADDSYIDIEEDFLLNRFSIEEVEKLYKEGELGRQYCLKSREAFSKIKFLGHEDVDITKYDAKYEKKITDRVQQIRQERIDLILNEGYVPKGILARDAIKNDYVYNSGTQSYEICEKESEKRKQYGKQ